jgi:hypothetical protein
MLCPAIKVNAFDTEVDARFNFLLKFRRSDSRLPDNCIFNNIDKMEQGIRFNFITKYLS